MPPRRDLLRWLSAASLAGAALVARPDGRRAGLLRPEPGPVPEVRLARPAHRALRRALLPRRGGGREDRRAHGRALVRAPLAAAELHVQGAQADRHLRVARRLCAEQRVRRSRRGDRRRHGRRAPAQHVLPRQRPRRDRARDDARNGAPVPVRRVRATATRATASRRWRRTARRPGTWRGWPSISRSAPTIPATDAIMRDAALNGNLPTMKQMTDRPRPVLRRTGTASRSGASSASAGATRSSARSSPSTPTLGVDRAFKRHTGLRPLGARRRVEGDDADDVPARRSPRSIARARSRSRCSTRSARAASSPCTSRRRSRRTAGRSPTSPPATCCARKCSSTSTSPTRRPASASSASRRARSIPSSRSCAYAYSQSAFAPDGRTLAFTAQTGGKDVLYLEDVKSLERHPPPRHGPRVDDRADVVAGRQADRLQRRQGRLHESLQDRLRRPEPAADHDRRLGRADAGLVARRTPHRVRQRSRAQRPTSRR